MAVAGWEVDPNGGDSATDEASNGVAENHYVEPVAIVGLAFKFPGGVTDCDGLWEMLMERKCATTKIPSSRLNIDSYHHPDKNRLDSLSFSGGHFLEEDIAAFDAGFFSFTPTETAALDPQQRILLETAYHALENAGISMADVAGTQTSVHTGCFSNDYAIQCSRDSQCPSKYAAVGLAQTMLANRISWFFDLKGPSVNLDSACSSSMMALDMGCQALQNGDATMGIVGGCNLIFNFDGLACLDNMGFLSPDSRCFSFDDRANGYSRGEGFGVLIIKLLKDAIRDNDTIRAVIRSTASNQDGRTPNVSQPNKDSQRSLILHTYKKAGIDLDETSYFESHGTGTAVGDPTEAGAIAAAFRRQNAEKPLYIGAIKSNIGHLEGASGVAGLIKTVLALERGVIPPNTNFERLNPRVDAEYLNLKFPATAIPWPSDGLRRASVSSFGFGGSNSHAVLEDAYHHLQQNNLMGNHVTDSRLERSGNPDLEPKTNGYHSSHDGEPAAATQARLLVFSAAHETSLQHLLPLYKQHFSKLGSVLQGDAGFRRDLAYTLSARRSHFTWRTFAVAEPGNELSVLFETIHAPIKAKADVGVGLVFSGQGAQWHAMGRELLAYPAFRASLEDAEKYFTSLGCQWLLLDEFLAEKSTSRVNEAWLSQTMCTALQVALCDLLKTFGIKPRAVIGHSSGEIAAAYCAQAISREYAWKVAYYRGVLASLLESPGPGSGSMMAAALSAEEAQGYIDAQKLNPSAILTVACINSGNSVTLSGDTEEIEALQSVLHQKSIFARKLKVNVAYHSAHMERFAQIYSICIGDDVELMEEHTAPLMISSVTADRIASKELRSKEYWVKNLVSPVRFFQALSKLCASSTGKLVKKIDLSHRYAVRLDHLIEVGPHSALQAPIRETLDSVEIPVEISYASLIIRHRSASTTLLHALGDLHSRGYIVDLCAANCLSGETKLPLALPNLPSYPFNHSQSYWFESRLSKELRFRKHARSDLLGTPVNDNNPFEAKWRHIWKVSEQPWLEDHKINGAILYPGAGMVVMAIEAACQTSDPNRHIEGFTIKDTVFRAPLHIPSTDAEIETQLYLRSTNDSDNSRSTKDFRLCTFDGEHWLENCHGSITIQYGNIKDACPPGECSFHKDAYDKWFPHSTAINRDWMYRRMGECGFDYGPAYMPISSIWYCKDDMAFSEVTTSVAGTESDAPPRVVHPATLDGILQLSFTALTKACTEDLPTTIPTRIRRLWISGSGLAAPQTNLLKVFCKSRFSGPRCTESIVYASDAEMNIRLALEGLETTLVADKASNKTQKEEDPLVFYNVDWKPNVDFMDAQQTLTYSKPVSRPDPSKFFRELTTVLFHFLRKALDIVYDSSRCTDKLPPHLHKYIAWMKWMEIQLPRTVDSDEVQGMFELSPEEVARICTTLQQSGGQGRAFVAVGSILPQILAGEVDPLQFLLGSDLLKDYYHDVFDSVNSIPSLRRYLEALVHVSPGMRFLEVGAGTGGMTKHVLDVLDPFPEATPRAPKYARYDYTDISPTFFERAREDFGKYAAGMAFRVLDVDKDAVPQGFEDASYDVIIASSVLHATKNLDDTVSNLRKLLKPGGRLVLFEVTRPDILRAGFIFGLLPGWWQGTEELRLLRPCVTDSEWKDILVRHDFSPAQTVFTDYDDPFCQEMSIIIATATSPSADLQLGAKQAFPRAVLLVGASDLQSRPANLIKDHIDRVLGVPCSIISLKSALSPDTIAGSLCIVLDGIEHGCLRITDADGFAKLKMILLEPSRTFWVTGNDSESSDNDSAAIDGLARTTNTEAGRPQVIKLAVNNTEWRQGQYTECLLRILESVLTSPEEDIEPEFLLEGGMIHTNRVTIDHQTTKAISRIRSPNQPEDRKFGDSVPLKLSVASLGLLDSLQFVEDTGFSKPLEPDEVEIEVKAFGINFKDCLTALGQINQDALGCECAGVITRAGEQSAFVPGDRVMAFAIDTMRTYARTSGMNVVRIPAGLSYPGAAALPTNLVTAWYSLQEVAHLGAGESVLIHSGAGGTGQAAIQVAQYLGAEVFTTTSSEEKRNLIQEVYGVPRSHILNSRDLSFAGEIRRLTQGRGVDVVLNSLSGDALTASWECVAPYGRFVELGLKDILQHGKLPLFQFARNVTFRAIDLAAMSVEQPQRISRTWQALMPLLVDRRLRAAKPLQVFGLSDIERAFREMQGGGNMGKMVVSVDPSCFVKTVLDTSARNRFSENATYVIGGGLGGLGRSIVRWMVRRGARHFILLSRSGPSTPAAASFVQEMLAADVDIATPACDISDYPALESCMKDSMSRMPPIRGCIQSAMVLKDAIFNNMTFEAWKTSTDPKMAGSWNLHRACPSGMDFFVLLSSITGIVGSPGQANYCAGNTSMDGLARHRVSRGEKAVSIDLSIMDEVGFLAENPDFLNRWVGPGHFVRTNQEQLFAMLDHFCDPALPICSLQRCQVVLGVEVPAKLHARGVEEAPWLHKPLFRHLYQIAGSDTAVSSASSPREDAGSSFVNASTITEAVAVVTEAFATKLSKTLSIPKQNIDASSSPVAYGVDSLVAVELRNWFSKQFGVDIPIFDILGGEKLSAISEVVARTSPLRKSAKTP